MEYKVSEILNIISGGTPRRNNSEYWNGDIPWLTVKDFNNDNRLVHDTQEKITMKGLENSSATLVSKGTIVISARGTVGELCQVAKSMTFNQSCFGLEAKTKYTTNEYIYYWFKYKINYVKSNTHGSVFDTINRKTFENLYINFPNIRYQNKVVNILRCLDNKIENNKQIIKNLEELSQTLFKRWFVDFEFPDESGNPYKSSGGEMVDSELGEIPRSWKVDELGNYIKIKSGKRPKNKVDNQDIENVVPIIGASKIMGYTNDYLYNEKIIIIGRVGTHGVIQRFSTRTWPSDNTFVITSDFESIIYQVLKSIDYISLNRGSTQPLLSQKDIKNTKVAMPSNATLLSKFQKENNHILKMMDQKIIENKNLTQLRDTLLPKLMSGKIEIPDDIEVNEDELSI